MYMLYLFGFFLHFLYLTVSSTSAESPNLSQNKIKVPVYKFCPLGRVLDFSPPNPTTCRDVVGGTNWTGFIYDSQSLKRIDPIPANYQFIYLIPMETDLANCGQDGTGWTLLKNAVNQSNFIILTDGRLMWRSNRCTCGKCKNWLPFPAAYYLDGVGTSDPEDPNSFLYSGQESDQILYVCSAQYNQIEADKAQTAIRNDKIFVVVLFATAFIYLITLVLYGILWKGSSLPAKVVFSVILSRTLMSIMLGLAYTGKLYRWDVKLPSWCISIGKKANN